MGRSAKGKKQTKQTTVTNQSPTYTSAQLLEKAEELMVSCEFELVKQFCQRALEAEPAHATALELAAIAEIELGEDDAARQHLLQASKLPQPAPSIFLYLAQLAESPQEALERFASALHILSGQLETRTGSQDEPEIRRSASRALIGMTELYLTDLCFEPEAEQKCTEYLEQAASIDPTDSEIYQTLASVRLSQHKEQEAIQALHQSWSIWKDEPEGGPLMPPFASRVSLAKLFVETGQHAQAYEVLVGLENEDNEDAEVQYLLGLNLFLKVEPTVDSKGKVDGDDLRLGTEAQNFLQSCLKIQQRNNTPEEEDRDMIAHVSHMLNKLGQAGVPIRAEEAPDEEAEEEWEDEDDDDEDVDMAS